MADFIIPGNLVVKNGGSVTFTGSISYQNKDVFVEGVDVVVDGTSLHVKGDVKIGGDGILWDANCLLAHVEQ